MQSTVSVCRMQKAGHPCKNMSNEEKSCMCVSSSHCLYVLSQPLCPDSLFSFLIKTVLSILYFRTHQVSSEAMKFTISAFLASLPYLNLVKAAPAPSYTEAAATYTVSKCVTYYGSTNAATMRTTTSYNSVTFYDSTTSTKYPYTFTRTPAVSTTFKTNSTTVYSTSVCRNPYFVS